MDPVLAAHLVANQVFEIGGQFSPASIRDQMVRACLVVDRAVQQGIIGPGKDLLVVGAGSTGVTAAIRAAQHGVDVTIIERRPTHAFLLAGCRTRDVEPTLYDWPVMHWDQHYFAWTGSAVPLGWRSSKANLIALNWQVGLARALRAFAGRLRILFGTTVVFKHGVSASSLTLMPPPPSHRNPNHFGGVISCVGWGRENCVQLPYRGLPFWDSDDLEAPDFGLGPTASPRILISGGGDGALQDFIRVLTAKGAKEVFDKIRTSTMATPGILGPIEQRIQSAEDTAGRALSWSMPPQDRPILERLELEHLAAIQALCSSTAWPAVQQTILDVVRDPLPDVTLIHPGPVFTQCYPLNRFLVLLLLEVIGHHLRIKDAQLQTVTCSHNPPSDAHACYGQPHDVSYTVGVTKRQAPFDIVIVRHGILGPRSVVQGFGPAHTRQILPYFIEV